jgi:hypothetical protein
MIKNTSSRVVIKSSTIMYDTNGKIISQVKTKEVRKDKFEKIDRFKEKLDTYLDEKADLKKPVVRDSILTGFFSPEDLTPLTRRGLYESLMAK